MKRVLNKYVSVFISLLCVAAAAYAQSFEEQARGKIAALEAMVQVAESKDVYTEREGLTLRTADFFLRCANWDDAHVAENARSFRQLPNFKADANSLADDLADYERSEVIKILDDAIERLGLILVGTYTRTQVPKVDYAQARLLGDAIMQKDRPVFLADHVWKPSAPELQEFYGAQGSGYFSPSFVINEAGDIDPQRLSELANKASGNIGYVFLDHNNMPKWAREKYDNFRAGSRHYGKYDVDHPGARALYGALFKGMIPKMAGENYRQLGYMLFNEPSYPTAAGAWNTGGVSDYSKAKFKTWLRKKHESINDLNRLWETNFANFEDVNTIIPIDKAKQGTPEWYDWSMFNNDRITDWFRFLVTEISKYDSEARFHIKLMPWLWTGVSKDHGMDFEALTRLCNISGCDASAKSSNIHNKHEPWMDRFAFEWVNISMLFDFFKSVKPNQIIVDSETHFLSSVHFRDLYLKSDYVRATYWLAHMHGLCASKNWYWARAVNGQASRGGGSYAGSNNQQPAVLNELHATMIDLNTFSHEITAMQRQRKPLRIYYSLANAIQRTTYMEDVRANYESVFFEGMPLGFATAGILNEQDPSSWDAIQIWKTETVTQEEFDAMQAYLNQGGTVFMDTESFKQNEYGQVHKSLSQGRGRLIRVETLADMNQKAIALAAERHHLSAVRVHETNELGPKGCVWRCVKNQEGNHVVSLINLGKTTATVKLELKHATKGTVCKDMINGIVVSSHPQLKPKQVFFVEVTERVDRSSGKL